MTEKIGNVSSEVKNCTKCKKPKYLSQFSDSLKTQDGKRPQCKLCERNTKLVRKYGITVEQFDEMLREQNYRCACCDTIWPGGKYNRMNVDHDHITGRIRGLTCHACNTAIGGLSDDVPGLIRAVNYLKRHYEQRNDKIQ